MRAAIEAGVVEIIYEGEKKGLWNFKETAEIEQGGGRSMNPTSGEEVDIQIPKTRPLILSEALEKWPEERLACSADNLCTPMIKP